MKQRSGLAFAAVMAAGLMFGTAAMPSVAARASSGQIAIDQGLAGEVPSAHPLSGDGQGFAAPEGTNNHPVNSRPSYTVRLVQNNQGDAESLRSLVVYATKQLTKYSNNRFTIAAGTVPDRTPDRMPVSGEILVSWDKSTPCGTGGGLLGCTDTDLTDNGTVTTIDAARIWMVPGTGMGTNTERTALAHEFGHAQGLAHFDQKFEDKFQVMHPYVDPSQQTVASADYRSGDINGLRHLVPVPRPYEALGGTLVGDPDVASWGANRYDVFVRGTDNALYHNWFDSSGWHGFESLGGTLASDPSAVSWGPNRIDVFAKGADGHLIHKWLAGGAWSGWEDLGGVLASAPDASSWGLNRLDVFLRGTDNLVYQKTYNGTSWLPFKALTGATVGGPTAASWGANRIDVFSRNASNQLIHRWFANNAWSPASAWEVLSGGLTSDPEASSGAANRLDVFGRGTDNALYQRVFNGAWQPWIRRPATLNGGAGAGAWSATRRDVFVRWSNNSLYHLFWDR